MKSKPIGKETELSIKALWASMFMATICIYIIAGFILRLFDVEDFSHYISFAFLIQGLVISMIGSAAWTLSFGHNKNWRFVARYLLSLAIMAASFAVSMLIPVINAAQWHLLWLICGLFSTIAFGTGIAVFSEKHLKKTGKRSALLWEVQ